jgi:3-oxoacyl-[acyl-carrier protein] reductase
MRIAFDGSRVLVVGAAHGIGRVVATGFADAGARVLACDILEEKLQVMARPARDGLGSIGTARVDVTDEASIAALVDKAGPIDVLVYVAGGVLGQTPRPVEEVQGDDWRSIVDVNLTGAFLLARAVVPGMKQAGKGRIVTISSRAGLAPSLTGIQSYCAAKHGQIGLVRQLGQELAPFNITVNSVAPGFMRTSPDTERQWASYTPEFKKEFESRLVGRRHVAPEDIAHAVLFLASVYASSITGQVLPVTGSPS